jgi:hypothetical protein
VGATAVLFRFNRNVDLKLGFEKEKDRSLDSRMGTSAEVKQQSNHENDRKTGQIQIQILRKRDRFQREHIGVTSPSDAVCFCSSSLLHPGLVDAVLAEQVV